MITQELLNYWKEQQEPHDLNALAFKLGLKSKAPVIKRLKGVLKNGKQHNKIKGLTKRNN